MENNRSNIRWILEKREECVHLALVQMALILDRNAQLKKKLNAKQYCNK